MACLCAFIHKSRQQRLSASINDERPLVVRAFLHRPHRVDPVAAHLDISVVEDLASGIHRHHGAATEQDSVTGCCVWNGHVNAPLQAPRAQTIRPTLRLMEPDTGS